jgi:hypothetical protein
MIEFIKNHAMYIWDFMQKGPPGAPGATITMNYKGRGTNKVEGRGSGVEGNLVSPSSTHCAGSSIL